MKITFISQYFHPEQFSNNAIAAELVERGHSVDVFSCVPNYPAGEFFDGYSNSRRREETWNGVRIHRVWTVPRGKTAVQLLFNFLCFPVCAIWTMMRRIKSTPDVSFVSMPSPLFQAFAGIALRWWKGTPCVYWVQDIWPESVTYTLGIENRLVRKLLSAVCGWLYRRADIVLVQSAAFPPMIARFGVAPHKIRVLPNTAPQNYQVVAPDDARAEAELVPQQGFRLMFAGNIGESQDFDTILAAADLLRDMQELSWVIVGSGRDLERVLQRVEELGLENRMHFLGRHPEDRMPKFFAHADALLVSLRDIPIFSLTVPYKVQCYMACGKPIVAVLSGEGARVLEDARCGHVAPAGDHRALAQAVVRLVESAADERRKLGENARAYYERHYASELVYGNLESWLQSAAQGAGLSSE